MSGAVDSCFSVAGESGSGGRHRRAGPGAGANDAGGGAVKRGLQQQSRGRSAPLERLIVVARDREDTTWIQLRLGDIPTVVYQKVSNITEHHTRCPPGGGYTLKLRVSMLRVDVGSVFAGAHSRRRIG